MALVAEARNAENKPEIIGLSRYYMNPLVCYVLRESAGMLALAKALGFRLASPIDRDAVQVKLDL